MPAKMLFSQFDIGVGFVSQCCTLVAAESNGHCSAVKTVVSFACIGPLLLVGVCTVFKICQLFLKQEGELMVNVFLRICSKAQHQTGSLSLYIVHNLFCLQYNRKGAHTLIKHGWKNWHPLHGQQLTPLDKLI